MKASYKMTLIGMALGFSGMMTSCADYDWSNEHDTTLSEFTIVTGDITVDATTENPSSEVVVEWNKSVTNDATLVFYKVVFSTKPDMSDVFYSVDALNFGVDTKTTLRVSEINKIAELGGIPEKSEGVIYWSVKASTGIAEVINSSVHKLTVNRPEGFAYNPTHLFVETAPGEYLTMKKLSDGEFELYAQLPAGKYKIAERLSSDKYRYFVANGGKLQFGDQITVPAGNEVTHIYANFKNSTATVATVDDVYFLYLGDAGNPVKMNRKADEAAWDVTWHYTLVGSNYSYKFMVKETTIDNVENTLYYGYVRGSSISQTASTGSDYFYMYRCQDNKNTYSFRLSNNKNFQQNRDLLITATLGTLNENDPYFHSVVVKEGY